MADARRRPAASRPTHSAAQNPPRPVPRAAAPFPSSGSRAPQSPAPRLAIERLEVRHDRIVATVRVDPAHPDSTPRLARELAVALPDLPRHACVNPEGDYFASVMDHTSLPHVLEHIVIDLQTSAFAATDPDRVFTGVTRWTDAACGKATVEVSYHDDVTAIRAFRDAASLLNSLR